MARQNVGKSGSALLKARTKFKNLVFKVNDRPVRDHYTLQEKKFNQKTRNEEKATGIAPPEERELNQSIFSIIELFMISTPNVWKKNT